MVIVFLSTNEIFSIQCVFVFNVISLIKRAFCLKVNLRQHVCHYDTPSLITQIQYHL